MSALSDDPWTLQRDVKRAYLLRQRGLLTDAEFADVVSESLHKTTTIRERELVRGGF